MAPKSNADSAPPMRQSCGRCYRQKLRCKRSSNTGACDRCLRQNSQCVYSSSLPKGRPRMDRVVDESTRHGNVVHSKIASPGRGGQGQHLRNSSSCPTEASEAHSNASEDLKSDISAEMGMTADMSDNTQLPESSGSTTTNVPRDPLPWVESFNWENTQPQFNELDFDLSTFNLQAQTNNTIIPTAEPSSFWDNTGLGHGYGSSLCISDDNNNDSAVIVTQLIRLSVQLYPLCRTSYQLAEATKPSYEQTQIYQTSLINDSTFASVAAWLAHASTSMNSSVSHDSHSNQSNPFQIPEPVPEIENEDGTKSPSRLLHGVFSACQNLLQVLRDWQASVRPEISTAYCPSFNHLTPMSDIPRSPYFEVPMEPSLSSSSRSSSLSCPRMPGFSQHHDDISRNLVIACHTMLFSIFAAVLIILEHEAALRPQKDTAVLYDIRIVSVVQICSYLIEREHQAVDLFLTSQSSLSAAMLQSSDILGLWRSVDTDAPATDSATREKMNDLKQEVQERLARVQQILCIR